jgi:uncharacterized protein YlxW (UPF0749 family)
MDEFDNPRPSNSSDLTSMLLALTLTFACFAFVLFLMAQLAGIKQSTVNMEEQSVSADKLITKLKEARDTLDKTVENNKALVATSEQTQNQFTSMMRELDELMRSGDKDAELIIKGYGIKVTDTPGATTPGSTSTAPAAPKEEKKTEPEKKP